MNIHCPACSEITKSKTFSTDVMPGMLYWECPGCKTKFRIETQFYEVNTDDEKYNQEQKVG